MPSLAAQNQSCDQVELLVGLQKLEHTLSSEFNHMCVIGKLPRSIKHSAHAEDKSIAGRFVAFTLTNPWEAAKTLLFPSLKLLCAFTNPARAHEDAILSTLPSKAQQGFFHRRNPSLAAASTRTRDNYRCPRIPTPSSMPSLTGKITA